MVRISTQFFILALATLGCVEGSPTKRDVSKVEADLATVQADIHALGTAVSAFTSVCPNGTLAQLNVIQSAVNTLLSELSSATPDAATIGTVSEAQCQSILDTIELLEVAFFNTNENLEDVPECISSSIPNSASEKTVFTNDLAALRAANKPFETAMLGVCSLAPVLAFQSARISC